MEYNLTTSLKNGINTEESYLVTKGKESLLRIIGQQPRYIMMTVTASEDNGEYYACINQDILIKSFEILCEKIGRTIFSKKDCHERLYKCFYFNNKDDFLNNIDITMDTFCSIYDELSSGSC